MFQHMLLLRPTAPTSGNFTSYPQQVPIQSFCCSEESWDQSYFYLETGCGPLLESVLLISLRLADCGA